METNDKYLTVEECAVYFKVSVQYIRSLIRKELIPAKKFSSVWMINSSILKDTSILYLLKRDVEDQRRQTNHLPKIIALSFFSGAMGLDIGLEKAGIEILLASEIDPATRKTILLNKPNIGLIGDISNYSSKEIRKYANISDKKEIDLIVGGPPCQAFSTAGKREGFNDHRGNVFLTFIDRILELRPKYAVIENVRGLLSAPLTHRPHSNRGFGYPPITPEEEKGGALHYIIKLLRDGGYEVSFNLYNAANYGSPQKRERVVIICSRDGKIAPFLPPTNSENKLYGLPKWKTFKEVTNDLNENEQEHIKFPEKRLKYYRMLKPGQYWRHLPLDIQKEALGASYFAGGGKTGFFRRLDWDSPAPTLVTNPAMPATDLAHPEKNRPLSIQEYIRVQEFPDSWKFFGNITEKYKQIGNAVPVSLGYAIGKHINNLLNKKSIRKTVLDFPYSRYKNTTHTNFIKDSTNKEFILVRK
jgi:DNA (cytosine-5)-methyltransferase 1